MAMNGPVGMDFGAILAMGAALNADQAMLAEMLAPFEAAALSMFDTLDDEPAPED